MQFSIFTLVICVAVNTTFLTTISMASLVDTSSNGSDIVCPVCRFDYADCEPTTLPCGHTICMDDARWLSNCPVCGVVHDPEALKVSATVNSLALCLRALNLGALRRKKLVSLLELSGSLKPYAPSSSEKCCVCALDYADRDAVTFPCGHSCCVKDSKRMTVCRVCRSDLPAVEDRLVSPVVQELARAIRDWGSNRPQLSPKASFRVDDVLPESLCLVELVEVTTRPGVIVEMCSGAGCMNAANYVSSLPFLLFLPLLLIFFYARLVVNVVLPTTVARFINKSTGPTVTVWSAPS